MRFPSIFNGYCPACRSNKVRRSHTRGRELVLVLVFLRPQRCQACGVRFWCFQRRVKKVLRAVVLGGVLVLGAAGMWWLFKVANSSLPPP